MSSSPLTMHSSQVHTYYTFYDTYIDMYIFSATFYTTCTLYIGMRTAFRRLVWRSVILDEGHRVKNEVCKIITIYCCICISIVCVIMHFLLDSVQFICQLCYCCHTQGSDVSQTCSALRSRFKVILTGTPVRTTTTEQYIIYVLYSVYIYSVCINTNIYVVAILIFLFP